MYDNFGLFNEIQPMYISMNLGRNVSPFADDGSLPQESFRLLKREAFHLGVSGQEKQGDNHLMVNFLRCDEPKTIIRVVAYECETNNSYSFDLTYEDLLLFTDGNVRLIDQDGGLEVCQMILNNLTLIKRRTQQTDLENNSDYSSRSGDENDELEGNSKMSSKRPVEDLDGELMVNPPLRIGESSLAVEHRIFFGEYYRSLYERNKMIFPKNERRRKGAHQDVATETEY